MATFAADVLMGGGEGPRSCSVLCDPPVEFASLADYSAHRALVHGPIHEVAVGGRDGPVFQIHRTSQGYICPRGHGPFPIQDKFCSHIRRCVPRPVDLQPGSLHVSWTLISGTIPVVKALGAPTGRTKSGRTIRTPAVLSQQPMLDVLNQPARASGRRKSAIQLSKEIVHSSSVTMPQRAPPQQQPAASSSFSQSRPPAQARRVAPSSSISRLRPSGARHASSVVPRSPSPVPAALSSHSRSSEGIASANIENGLGYLEALFSGPPSGGRSQKRRALETPTRETSEAVTVASSSAPPPRSVKRQQLSPGLESIPVGAHFEHKPVSQPPTSTCGDCTHARIFRTLDALYNHRVDVHGDLYRFTIIDGQQFVTSKAPKVDEIAPPSFCPACQTCIDSDLVVLQAHVERCQPR